MAAEWGNIPVAPHTAPPRRVDPRSPLRRALEASGITAAALRGVWATGNGDPALDDWEEQLLAVDLAAQPALLPPRSLTPRFGQHGGLGALRVAAAALAAGEGPAPRPRPRPRRLPHRDPARQAHLSGVSVGDHLIVIPVFNEAATIEGLVDARARLRDRGGGG